MTDYSKMIDFEINKLVALSIGGFESEDIFQLQGVIFKRHGKYQYSFFDPCNNPSDAWPIIVKNNISLHAPRFKEGWMAEFTGGDEDVNDGFDVDYFDAHNENPLRAAMIVYLMMKESENG